jgi:hypothetical protein
MKLQTVRAMLAVLVGRFHGHHGIHGTLSLVDPRNVAQDYADFFAKTSMLRLLGSLSASILAGQQTLHPRQGPTPEVTDSQVADPGGRNGR